MKKSFMEIVYVIYILTLLSLQFVIFLNNFLERKTPHKAA